jgi:hypothetical protein
MRAERKNVRSLCRAVTECATTALLLLLLLLLAAYTEV